MKTMKLPIDKWQLLDVVFAGSSMGLILFLTSLPLSWFTDTSIKHNLSYAVVVVSIFQYFRVFLYFLVVSSVSKMLLTLYMMILDTLAFILLLATWIFVSAVVFTTMFQDTTDAVYKDLYTSCLVLFDALLGGYATIGIG